MQQPQRSDSVDSEAYEKLENLENRVALLERVINEQNSILDANAFTASSSRTPYQSTLKIKTATGTTATPSTMAGLGQATSEPLPQHHHYDPAVGAASSARNIPNGGGVQDSASSLTMIESSGLVTDEKIEDLERRILSLEKSYTAHTSSPTTPSRSERS